MISSYPSLELNFSSFRALDPLLLKKEIKLSDENFQNKTIYSSFWSVEATDFKNLIKNKIHLAEFEAAEI